MSEIKPVYQWQHSNHNVFPESWWKDCTEEDFKARDNKMQFNVRIMFETTAVIESLRRDNEALQKENAELKATISNLTKAYERESNDGLKALEERDYWYSKAAEQLEAIEATAEFAKAFWEKADKHRDTRVMVSTFQQLEQKLRTYLSKNGE